MEPVFNSFPFASIRGFLIYQAVTQRAEQIRELPYSNIRPLNQLRTNIVIWEDSRWQEKEFRNPHITPEPLWANRFIGGRARSSDDRLPRFPQIAVQKVGMRDSKSRGCVLSSRQTPNTERRTLLSTCHARRTGTHPRSYALRRMSPSHIVQRLAWELVPTIGGYPPITPNARGRTNRVFFSSRILSPVGAPEF